MSTFSSLLSQLQNNGPKAPESVPQPRPVTNVKTGLDRTRPVPVNLAASSSQPAKRKRDDDEITEPRKAPKAKSTTAPTIATTDARKDGAPPKRPQVYRSTMNAVDKASRNLSPTVVAPPKSPVASPKAIDGAGVKPKRGFASLMAKAAAAQEASKAAGPDTIRHKSVDKLSKRDRLRMAQETTHPVSKHGKPQLGATSSAGAPSKAASYNGFQARTKPIKHIPKVTYQGTMRADSAVGAKIRSHKKGEGQDKYGGYASWSDLDDAEDDEQGSYESGSDMEEAGYDEMMEEELKSARIARREDEAALREEERLKQEKLERKKRLMALNSSAATAKKRY